MLARAVERADAVKMDVIDTRRRSDLHGFIKRHVSDDAEAIFTDEWAASEGLAAEGTRHQTVNHSAEGWGGGRSTPTASRTSGGCSRSIVGA